MSDVGEGAALGEDLAGVTVRAVLVEDGDFCDHVEISAR